MTSRIIITADEVRRLLSYDPHTGIFTWLMRFPLNKGNRVFNTKFAHKRAGTRNEMTGYRSIKIKGIDHSEHLLAYLYMTGELPTCECDHHNRIKDDNRWENLRPSSLSQNRHNVGLRRDNKSGAKGVTQEPNGKWRAQIQIDKKMHYLGIYPTKEAAMDAYANAAERHVKEFMVTAA